MARVSWVVLPPHQTYQPRVPVSLQHCELRLSRPSPGPTEPPRPGLLGLSALSREVTTLQLTSPCPVKTLARSCEWVLIMRDKRGRKVPQWGKSLLIVSYKTDCSSVMIVNWFGKNKKMKLVEVGYENWKTALYWDFIFWNALNRNWNEFTLIIFISKEKC